MGKSTRLIKNLTLSAIFIALITTSIFFVRINLPWGGVIHFGDSLVWIAAAVLPFPFGLFVAALGPGLFNLFAGLTIWFPFTIVIKPIISLCFKSRKDGILNKRNVVAPFAAGFINMALYYLATVALLFYGVISLDGPSIWIAAAVSLPFDALQAIGSIAMFFLLAAVLDKIGFKQRFMN